MQPPRRVQVVPYDLSWKHNFKVEAEQITSALGDIVVAIHHIGSTAIPGVYAKPIIDCLLEVDDILRLDSRTSVMEALGYEAMGEFGLSGRRYFRKDDAQGVRTHHVHAYEAGSSEVQRHLAFRDYMIASPSAAQAYSDLKRRLARDHPYDTQAYMDGKDAFVKEHEARAVAWWSPVKTG